MALYSFGGVNDQCGVTSWAVQETGMLPLLSCASDMTARNWKMMMMQRSCSKPSEEYWFTSFFFFSFIVKHWRIEYTHSKKNKNKNKNKKHTHTHTLQDLKFEKYPICKNAKNAVSHNLSPFAPLPHPPFPPPPRRRPLRNLRFGHR